MADIDKPWILRDSLRWTHLRAVKFGQLWVLLAAVFLLFSITGFYVDLTASGGTMPYLCVAGISTISGINAVLWIVMVTRTARIYLIPLIVAQFFIGPLSTWLSYRLIAWFHLKDVAAATGNYVAATGMMCLTIGSYSLFITYIRRQGVESFRMQNELELAHGIQKTLVPAVSLRTVAFEIYGISCPSEKVGGDLVDAVCLPGGDAIAYLADIAGHGLQAGILMGMVKTAARTALLEAGERTPAETLPVLLGRLNTVLPEVKEAHMFATFTGFRLGVDGSVHYAMAASPPILHWHAAERNVSHSDEAQFPLGLLPVKRFDGATIETLPGDLIVVATDGVLEAMSKTEEEFGLERLKDAIAANGLDPLPELAAKILAAARAFGKQFDDQTLLIVRRV